VDEARLEETPGGLVPASDGWFVLNARDAPWLVHEHFGARCGFEVDGRLAATYGVEARHFPQLGLKLSVIGPGQRSTLYHAENAQEDFLVLQGECLALVEGEERRVGPWDLIHCPPGTAHTFVNDGDDRCVLLMVGARIDDHAIVYPVSEQALRHGAGVERETASPHEAYAPYPHWAPGERPEL
jgi:uncharacterized cupin superfamily protein